MKSKMISVAYIGEHATRSLGLIWLTDEIVQTDFSGFEQFVEDNTGVESDEINDLIEILELGPRSKWRDVLIAAIVWLASGGLVHYQGNHMMFAATYKDFDPHEYLAVELVRCFLDYKDRTNPEDIPLLGEHED